MRRASQCGVDTIGVQVDDVVDETEGSSRETDAVVVNDREATGAFITGTGTGTGTCAAKVGRGTELNSCVPAGGGVGAKILVSSGSDNDGRVILPTLLPI